MQYCDKCDNFTIEYDPKIQSEKCINPECESNKEESKGKRPDALSVGFFLTQQKYC